MDPPRYDYRQLGAVTYQPSALSFSCQAELSLLMDSKLVKDLENDLSQLNRLGVAYFLLAYFRFLPRITSALLFIKSVGAQLSVLLLSHSVSNDFQTHC